MRYNVFTPGLLQCGPEAVYCPGKMVPLPGQTHASLLKDLRSAPRLGELGNQPLGELLDAMVG